MGKCILAGHPQAGGQIGYGTYTGNGKAAQKISLGVTPKWVLVLQGGYNMYGGQSSPYVYGGLALSGKPARTQDNGKMVAVLEVVNGGFQVYNGPNYPETNLSQTSYHYLYGY